MIDQTGRILRGHPLLADAALWVAVTGFALTLNMPHPFFTLDRAIDVAVVAVAGVLSRRFPSLALAIAIGIAQRDGHYYGVVALVAFLSGLRTGRMRPFAWAPALAVPAVCIGGFGDGWRSIGGMLVSLGASIALPWLIGRYLLQRRELAAAGWDRARHLEREHEMHAERARLRERARIAQDMHDSLGHDLALLALRASVLEMDPELAAAQRTQAADLRAGAAAATDRLHEIIGVLRADAGQEGDGPGTPAEPAAAPLLPVHETLGELVTRARGSGLLIYFVRTVEDQTPSAVGRAVHRVVQEALTNAAKHAPGTEVRVSVAYRPGGTEVRVVNARPEPPMSAADTAPGSRSGLIGLGERVRLAGGTFRAGPTGDGFTVAADFPHPVAHTAAAHTAVPRGEDPAR
ncbi:MAG: hypothetical protein HOV68_03080 [Streptomycetaceae bacterium]|nr:hypothetical protein [Streptomycetaceae bacterium]